jgi:hypothetical protein
METAGEALHKAAVYDSAVLIRMARGMVQDNMQPTLMHRQEVLRAQRLALHFGL